MVALLLGLTVAMAPVEAKGKKGKTRATPIAIKKGLPTAEGLGKLVFVSNLPTKDKRWKAIKAYAKERGAKTLRFKENDVASVAKGLAKAGAEFVAFAVPPETLDINFHYSVLELCRDLDRDPMPDFYFGYLVARDAPDMEAWIERIKKRHANGFEKPVSKIIALTGSGEHVKSLDMALHFGHGTPWGVNDGLTGEQVGALALDRTPLVWSGACFNAVVSRSFHKSAYHMVWSSPWTVAPEKSIALNWVHAGVLGYFAALEGDRGEMATTEWEYFRRKACSLGEVIGHQYRLITTSLSADWTKFPRHLNRYKKFMSFYNVMLRGATSRILFGDPSLRPLSEPLDTERVNEVITQVDRATGAHQIQITALRWSQWVHQNYLPKEHPGFFGGRLTARVELPADWPQLPNQASKVTLFTKGEDTPIAHHHVRHEVWGGMRYVNLQVQTPTGKILKGSQALFEFAPSKKK